ncbi:MAG: HDOD domain-containing protein [Candidatus Krumholzibacteriia bacterium]
MTTQLSLLDLIEQRIAEGRVELPPANEISSRLQSVTTDPDFAMGEVVEIIGSDQALTAGVLRVANSAFYGGLSPVRTVRDAVVRLGAPELVRLAVLSAEKAAYQASTPQLREMIPDLWRHASATALGARWLARKLGFSDQENEAFIGGLLHDVGSLMLVRIIDDLMATGELEVALPPAVLAEVIGTGHTKHGYHLTRHWNLPEIYCEVVRDHHREDLAEAGSLINLVALADKACLQLGIGLEADASLRLDATDEAQMLGASDLVLAQLSIMLEDAQHLV